VTVNIAHLRINLRNGLGVKERKLFSVSRQRQWRQVIPGDTSSEWSRH